MRDPDSPIKEIQVLQGEIPKRFEIHYHTTGRIKI